jgi:hypothetical protein
MHTLRMCFAVIGNTHGLIAAERDTVTPLNRWQLQHLGHHDHGNSLETPRLSQTLLSILMTT